MAKIKICGLTRLCDIDAVNAAMPDYVGFVFAKSRRRVNHAQALMLRKRLADGIVSVGVFADASLEEIAGLTDSGIIDAVQLHGSEDDAYIDKLRTLIGNKTIIKAAALNDISDALNWNDTRADYPLFDTAGGGSGKTFDWELIKTKRPFFLAGGLHAGNIEAALKMKPYAVDISSGVETDGVKDFKKIQTIVGMVRGE